LGVATTFLDSLSAGDKLQVAVRPSNAAFSLPADPESTPGIYIAAGAGIAPFRGFVQDRVRMLSAGRKVAPAILFFGCRSPEEDDLYREELDEWQFIGAIDVRRAYSKAPEKSEGCKYVQDRMWKDRADVVDLWLQGAKVYVCGSKGVAESAKEVLVKTKMAFDQQKGNNTTEDSTRQRLEELKNIRYVADVFD
jgi:cytochrome P450 / NADPH-cytochrome P450 reductase